jgi:hypothetical protein
VSEDAAIEPRTAALAVRRSNRSARSHPQRNNCSVICCAGQLPGGGDRGYVRLPLRHHEEGRGVRQKRGLSDAESIEKHGVWDPTMPGVDYNRCCGSGYGSLYHQAKKVRKTLIPTALW